MTKPQSSIHPPLITDEEAERIIYSDRSTMPIPTSPAIPTRIQRLGELDRWPIHGNPQSLGHGGSSSVFSEAIRQALRDELADQLRGITHEGRLACPDGIGEWAREIIEAFREKPTKREEK